MQKAAYFRKGGLLLLLLFLLMLVFAMPAFAAAPDPTDPDDIAAFFFGDDVPDGITFRNDATYPWQFDTENSAMFSGNKGVASTTSTLSLTTTKLCAVTFSWKVSSERDWDYLYYAINGEEQGRIDGVTGLISGATVYLSPGDTLSFCYDKDNSIDSNQDCGWIGNLQVVNEGDFSIQLDADYADYIDISADKTPTGTDIYPFGTEITLSFDADAFAQDPQNANFGVFGFLVNGQQQTKNEDNEYSFLLFQNTEVSLWLYDITEENYFWIVNIDGTTYYTHEYFDSEDAFYKKYPSEKDFLAVATRIDEDAPLTGDFPDANIYILETYYGFVPLYIDQLDLGQGGIYGKEDLHNTKLEIIGAGTDSSLRAKEIILEGKYTYLDLVDIDVELDYLYVYDELEMLDSRLTVGLLEKYAESCCGLDLYGNSELIADEIDWMDHVYLEDNASLQAKNAQLILLHLTDEATAKIDHLTTLDEYLDEYPPQYRGALWLEDNAEAQIDRADIASQVKLEDNSELEIESRLSCERYYGLDDSRSIIRGRINCPEENIILEGSAKLTVLPEEDTTRYTVHFESNGGSEVEKQRIREDEQAREPETPVREGYVFAGWYVDEACTEPYDFSEKVTDYLTLYAKWEELILPNPFADITGHWAYDDILYMYSKGYMQGVTADSFAPGEPMNRAMLVTILWRMEGEPANRGNNAFSDVAAGSYYYDAVLWAVENSIVQGMDASRFAPDQPLTREQMATILYRYITAKGLNLPSTRQLIQFADDAQISPYAKDALYSMYYMRIMEGRGNDTIDPQGNATRAEVAAMLHRFLQFSN